MMKNLIQGKQFREKSKKKKVLQKLLPRPFNHLRGMCCEDFFLSLKANNELFNFIQQAALLLTFAAALLCYFAFKPEEQYDTMQKYLQGISMGLWSFSIFLILTVVLAYVWESRYQKTRNVWGETIYRDRGVVNKKLKRQKVINRNDVYSSSSYGSTTPLKSLASSSSDTNMSANDVVVNVHSSQSSTLNV